MGCHRGYTDIFIYAPYEDRIKRAVDDYGVDPTDAENMLEEVDKARENYYKYHTGRKWGTHTNYHMSINSGYMQIDDIVDMIIEFLDKRVYFDE